MLRLHVGGIALLMFAFTAALAHGQGVEVGSSYSKVDDMTTNYARVCFGKTSGTLDTLTLAYSYRGKKQGNYIRPKWTLWLYDRNDLGRGDQTIRVLLNNKGPAERLTLRFGEHDSQFGGDSFTSSLTDELEILLLNARTLEFFPPHGQTAASIRLDRNQTNRLRQFLKAASIKAKTEKD